MRRELELKVELSKSDMERLAGDLPGADVEAGPASTQKIKTVYLILRSTICMRPGCRCDCGVRTGIGCRP